MRTTGEVRWFVSLDDDGGGGTTAWVVTDEQCRAALGQGLEPNIVDRDDIGARRGTEADRFIRRRLALRGLVARWCGVPAAEVVVGYDEAGRPVVRHPRPGAFCSVTARGDVFGLVLSVDPVGIDLEPDVSGPIASAVLSPSESTRLAALPVAERSRAFLEIWTVKEAYLKALGSGLLRDPSALTITGRDGLLSDGDHTIRLLPSAIQNLRVGEQSLVAACIAVPPRS